MGYTHYWAQKRHLTPAEWKDVEKIIKAATVPLGNANGDAGSSPDITDDHIHLNGVGDDAHETFCVIRVGSEWDFCKTARKPYDAVVTACLCYLSSIGSHTVSSDGDPDDFLTGLALAQRALPDQTALSCPTLKD